MLTDYQVFPVTELSFIGTATSEAVGIERLIECGDTACDITLVYPSGNKTFTAQPGARI